MIKSPYDARWRRWRLAKLRREPLCAYCLELGGTTAATTVHHIKRLRDHPELRLVDSNTVSLCKPCHDGPAQREEQSGHRPGCDSGGMPRDVNHPWSDDDE